MNTVILGSIAFDAIETPYNQTGKIIGGSGSYICFSASYFTKPQALGIIGGDFPESFIQKLKDKHVDMSGVEICPDEKSFFWSCRYFDNMNQRETLTTELNVVEHFTPKLPESYRNTDYVMLGNLSPVVQRQALEQMAKRPKLVVLDTMNLWIDIMLEELKRTMQMVDVIIINDEESFLLTQERNLAKAARKIQEMGPKYVIIKKGEHGAMLFGEGKIFSAPALPMEEVIDPTGAGDTFAGAFIGYLAQQDATDFESMKIAVIVATAMASFTIEKMGTEALENISASQIKDRLIALKEMTDFKL